MTNNKWFFGFALVIAFVAITFWWRETHARRVAELEHGRIQHALADARIELQTVANLNPAGSLQSKTNQASTTVVPTPASTSAAPSHSEERANVATETARKVAIAESLLRQRVRRLMNLEMNVRPKFQALGLSDEKWNRYQILSLEKIDLEEEAKRTRKAGQTPEEVEAAIRAAGGEILAEIKALVGDDAYDELARFQSERSDPARKTVESLARRLMFSNAPLESWQTEKLTQILRTQSSTLSPKGQSNGISNDISIGMRSVLTPPQLEYWRRLQIEQARMTDAAAISKRFESAKNASTR
jgi:hypothetical protein